MFRTRNARARSASLGLAVVGGALAFGGIGVLPASAGDVDDQALAVAQQQIGDPEQSGGTGPDSFDCSGLTQYSFRQAGASIPRTAQEQYNASTHKSQSAKEPGDLIFFSNSSGVYHVGIYEGNGNMISVSSSAGSVQRQQIWDSNYLVGSF
jgi:cell wall-associated NlpC family hydrolase